MRLVYAATAAFAVPPLNALVRSPHEIVAVITQPDRRAGRGRKPKASPVKAAALEASLAVVQPVSMRDAETQAQLRALAPDVMVVVAYGQILPQAVLDIPRLACLNIHASLLPRWRGAAPIQRAVLAGDKEAGVCIMKMDAGLDSGPTIACSRCEIPRGTSSGELHDRLAEMGAALLPDTLEGYADGRLAPRQQPTEGVCYAEKLTKEEARIDWSRPARDIERQVLGLNPWPVAQTRHTGQPLRIWRAYSLPAARAAAPGTVVTEGPEGIEVCCGTGALRITELQLPGRKPLATGDFLNAHSLQGEVLG